MKIKEMKDIVDVITCVKNSRVALGDLEESLQNLHKSTESAKEPAESAFQKMVRAWYGDSVKSYTWAEIVSTYGETVDDLRNFRNAALDEVDQELADNGFAKKMSGGLCSREIVEALKEKD